MGCGAIGTPRGGCCSGRATTPATRARGTAANERGCECTRGCGGCAMGTATGWARGYPTAMGGTRRSCAAVEVEMGFVTG